MVHYWLVCQAGGVAFDFFFCILVRSAEVEMEVGFLVKNQNHKLSLETNTIINLAENYVHPLCQLAKQEST